MLSIRVCFVVMLLLASCLTAKASLSFIIVDLKYNTRDGVKICEVQPGSLSVFKGYDYLTNDTGYVPKAFTEVMAKFFDQTWVISRDICDTNFMKYFVESNWRVLRTKKQLLSDPLFGDFARLAPVDDELLCSYSALLYARNHFFGDKERRQYPGILLMDEPLFPYFGDKEKMNLLFDEGGDIASYRPEWKSCECCYSKKLVDDILEQVTSEYLVIKPRDSSQGAGIIIIPREELDQTLKMILTKDETLLRQKNYDYRFWYGYHLNTLIVEQFVPSDPVAAIDGALYDPTMRVVLFLARSGGVVTPYFVEGHWKIPKKSLSEEGSLSEMHKSYGGVPHFAFVEQETLEEVYRQLVEVLIPLYERMH